MFLFGAVCVLYSTFFVAGAGFARLAADAARLFGLHDGNETSHRNWIRGFSVFYPLVTFAVYASYQAPAQLVLASGVAQALMLPVIGVTALWLRYRRVDVALRPGRVWDVMLWLSVAAFGVVGAWSLWTRLGGVAPPRVGYDRSSSDGPSCRGIPMTNQLYAAAYPFADDVLGLPVKDLDCAASYYSEVFGLEEVERRDSPPTVVMERDGVRVGFAINGRDPSQEGAAILVTDIHRARRELEERGVEIGNWRVDERDGETLQVFFVVAPDGLCYYFHQPIDAT